MRVLHRLFQKVQRRHQYLKNQRISVLKAHSTKIKQHTIKGFLSESLILLFCVYCGYGQSYFFKHIQENGYGVESRKHIYIVVGGVSSDQIAVVGGAAVEILCIDYIGDISGMKHLGNIVAALRKFLDTPCLYAVPSVATILNPRL